MTTTQTFSGLVKWFNKDLGFGFIAVAPSVKLEFGIPVDKDLYVHAENLNVPFPRFLQPEQKVTFEIQVAAKGPRAINVEVIP
jgi:cold shock CspA family protein